MVSHQSTLLLQLVEHGVLVGVLSERDPARAVANVRPLRHQQEPRVLAYYLGARLERIVIHEVGGRDSQFPNGVIKGESVEGL